jgi:hypothetical protein
MLRHIEMKLFLSYASQNRSTAEEIYYALVGAGHDVFFDQSSLPSGTNYTQRLREAIDVADGLVFLISPLSIEPGSYTLTELEYARKKWLHPENRVLPVMIKPTDFKSIPAYLKAVTILQPAGNIAAEVVESLPASGESAAVISEPNQIVSTATGLTLPLLCGILIATALGTLFSKVYPKVGMELNLVFLFTIIGMAIALCVRRLWRVVRRSGK